MATKAKEFLFDHKATVKEAMRRMSEIGEKQLFVVDGDKRLVGAISDGDIRKWILKGGHLRERVGHVCNHKPRAVESPYDLEQVRQDMLTLRIEAIPVVAEDGTVSAVLTWDNVFAGKERRRYEKLGVQVVIMAGGKGTRLDPFTRILPKPLIPVGDKPILQIIMDKFGDYGVKEFVLSVNHKARMIRSYFEECNGGYSIHYLEEDKPLGTVGSLRLLKNKIRGMFLVTNCDIIIDFDYNELVRFHQDGRQDITVVVSCKRYVIPYGICEVQGEGILKSIHEKPEYDLLVNTGMYVMEPRVLDLIPEKKAMDANELIEKAKKKGLSVGVFPIDEKAWIDVGQWEEYRKAINLLGV